MRPCPPTHPRPLPSSSQAIAGGLEATESAPPGSISRPLLAECAGTVAAGAGCDGACDVAAAAAASVVGGVVANAVVRAIGRVGAPLKNLFFFTLGDGQGIVEDISGPAAGGQ